MLIHYVYHSAGERLKPHQAFEEQLVNLVYLVANLQRGPEEVERAQKKQGCWVYKAIARKRVGSHRHPSG